MKEKIVGIFVCMLLIATAVPAVASIKINAIHATIPGCPQAPMGAIWNQNQKLLASDGVAEAGFGCCAALDGDTLFIGACQDDDNGHFSGSAYVFIRTGTTWTFQAKLLPSDGAAEEQFGESVALKGNTALIGAWYDNDNGVHSGSTYVFTRTGTTWTQQQKLLPADGVTDAQFGINLDLNGNTALIGANRDDDNGVRSGAAYVYTTDGTTWTQQAKLIASDGGPEERFGIDVGLEGDTALIGSESSDQGAYSGSVYVFTRSGTTWTQQQKIIPSDGAATDWFGFAISISGDTALFAASYDDLGSNSGSAYVYIRNGTTWTQQAKLHASDGAANDHFSEQAVALDGDTALIGAYLDNNDNGADAGSAYVFTRTGTTWTQQQKLLASDGAAGDYFSYWAVALQGNTALIGAWGDDDNGNDSGSAYVFTKVGLTYSITGGLGVSLKITNNGTVNVTGVPWLLQVKGGLLGMINKSLNGTFDIPAGGTKTVGTGMLFGFGALTITAKVADEEKTKKGTQIIIFTAVKK
jgi:hypothetical protein